MASITQRPGREILSGYESRFIAVHNPVIYTIKREDFVLQNIGNAGGNCEFDITGDVTTYISNGDTLYFTSSVYSETVVTVISTPSFAGGITQFDVALTYIADDTGTNYINLLSARSDYAVQIDIYRSSDNSLIKSTTGNKPFNSGVLNFDVAPWLRPLLSPGFGGSYTSVNAAHASAAIGFYIKYTVTYGVTTEAEVSDVANPYYATWTARQLKNLHGQNLGVHVAFNDDLAESLKAKFLSPFEFPMYWEGYPFSADFIIQDDGTGANYTRHIQAIQDDGTLGSDVSTSISKANLKTLNSITLPGPFGAPVDKMYLWIETDSIITNTAPVASSVAAAGTMKVGETLTASYIYTDSEGDPENKGATVVQWYTYDNAAGTTDEEPLYTGSGLDLNATLTATELNRYLRVKVTPAASSGVSPGLEVSSPVYGPIAAANAAPVASSLSITGTEEIGQTLTANYTYSDSDGDPQSLGGTTINWYSYTNAGLTTGETLLQSGNGISGTTYVITASEQLLWIAFKVTPAATTGTTPGAEVKSPGTGQIPVPLVKVATFKTDKDTSFTLTTAITNTVSYEIRYWDTESDTGTADNTSSYTGDGNTNARVHTFNTTGEIHRAEIWTVAVTDLLSIAGASQELTYVDLSSCTGLGFTATSAALSFFSNTSLSTFLTPATITGRVSLNLNSTAITSLNISGWRGLSGTFNLISCTSLGTLVMPTSTTVTDAKLTACEIRSCTALTSSIDLSGCVFETNYTLEIGNMASVPSYVLPDLTSLSVNTVLIWSMTNASLTKGYLDKIKFGGVVRIYSCPNITDLGSTGAGTFTPTWDGTKNTTQLQISLTNWNQAADFSGGSNLKTNFNVSNNSALGTWTMPTSNDNTFTTFYFNNNNQTSVDVTGFTVLSEVNNSKMEFRDMGMNTTNTNQLAVDLDAIVNSGFTGRTLNISGNSAPTTGPPNGSAAITQMTTDGVSCTTD